MDNHKFFLIIVIIILLILIYKILKKPSIKDIFEDFKQITYEDYLKIHSKNRNLLIKTDGYNYKEENEKNWNWIKNIVEKIQKNIPEKMYKFSQSNNIRFMVEKSIKLNKDELDNFLKNIKNVEKEERFSMYISTLSLTKQKLEELFDYLDIKFLKDMGKIYNIAGIMYALDIDKDRKKEKWYIDCITDNKEFLENAIEIKNNKETRCSYLCKENILYRFVKKNKEYVNDSTYISVKDTNFKINNIYRIYFLSKNFIDKTFSIYYRLD